MSDVLEQLAATLATRRTADPQESYVASLYHKGLDKILEKVGEEATEVVLAAKNTETGGDRKAVIAEVADLWFHSMVMLTHLDIEVGEVLEQLHNRFGISGHEEKAARGKQDN